MRIRYSFFCDFDGTVSVRDVTDVLLEAYAQPQWRDVEAMWRAGDIGSQECMQRQVALLRCSQKELDALLDAVAIDPGFVDFVMACHEADMPVMIVSDGIDYCIRRILHRAGLDWLPIYANKLQMLGEERYALASPHFRSECLCASGTCKCTIMNERNTPNATAVLIGDGASDCCAAREAADLVVAKASLLEYCREHHLLHVPYTDFYDVKRLFFHSQQALRDALERPADAVAGCVLHG